MSVSAVGAYGLKVYVHFNEDDVDIIYKKLLQLHCL